MAAVGAAVADALAYVHQRGIVHRDVKPSNILVADDGRVLLGDFGIARLAGSTRLTTTQMTIGTAPYMAPEQVQGAEVGPGADIYALGLVLLEALTGARSFPGPAQEAALARLVRDPVVPADLPPGWAQLLRAMTARHPTGRPDAAAAAARLGALEAGTDPDWIVPAETQPSTRVLPATAPLAGSVTRPLPADGPAATAAPPAAQRRALAVLPRGAIAGGLAALLVAGLLGLVMLAGAGDDQPRAPATTPPVTAPPDTAPPVTAPPATEATTSAPTTEPPETNAVDCAALEAEKRALEDQRQEIEREYRDDPETHERLKAEIEQRKREIDQQVDEHCRGREGQ